MSLKSEAWSTSVCYCLTLRAIPGFLNPLQQEVGYKHWHSTQPGHRTSKGLVDSPVKNLTYCHRGDPLLYMSSRIGCGLLWGYIMLCMLFFFSKRKLSLYLHTVHWKYLHTFYCCTAIDERHTPIVLYSQTQYLWHQMCGFSHHTKQFSATPAECTTMLFNSDTNWS